MKSGFMNDLRVDAKALASEISLAGTAAGEILDDLHDADPPMGMVLKNLDSLVDRLHVAGYLAHGIRERMRGGKG